MTANDSATSEDSYEFDLAELEGRAKAIVAIYGGPTWHVLDTFEEIIADIEAVVGDQKLLLSAHQEAGLPPARIMVNPNLIATVFEITEDRWKADRLQRHLQETAMREQATRGGGLVAPPSGPGPLGLN